MSLRITENELMRLRNDEEIVRETAEQVIKDFYLFGLHIDFPGDIRWAYDELFDQLEKHVSHMLEINDRKLLSLLYQIDVSEKKIQIEIQKNSDQPLHFIITDLILEREFKKVITRHYFKSMNNS